MTDQENSGRWRKMTEEALDGLVIKTHGDNPFQGMHGDASELFERIQALCARVQKSTIEECAKDAESRVELFRTQGACRALARCLREMSQ